MSLRIWLPLNGTLDNQGLDQITVTNNGATIDNNGKIGKCYSFDGNTSGININGDIIPTLAQGDFSTSFWVYNNDEGNRSIYMATIPSSNFGLGIQKTISEGLRIYWQGTPDYYPNLIIPVQEWCHIAVVIKSNNCYCYKNGILTASREDGSFTPQKLTNTWLYGMLGRDLRTGATVLKGKMNDFRWYDHALSPLEVKEISQGLILHYPLNRNGWGNENLLVDTYNWSTLTGTSTISEGYWYSNGGTAVRGYDNINNITYCKIWHSDSSSWTRYCRQYVTMQPNIYYTVSILCKINTSKAHLSIRNDRNSAITFFANNVEITNKNWQWKTFTAITHASTSQEPFTVYAQLNSDEVLSSETSIDIAMIKLEKGSIATPWCPNSADELAITLGLNDNIQYDTSGYGNNGEYYTYDINGSISYTSDTPKYNVSTHIASANPTQNAASGTRYLYGHCELTNPTQMSVAFWLKPITGGYGNTTSNGQGYFCTTNYEYGNTSVGVDYQTSAMNHRDGTVNMNDSTSTTQCNVTFYPTIGEWHHYVYTYDGQVGRGYKDGVQTATAQFSAAKTLDSFIGVVIGFSKAGGVWRRNDACYSDFRIYATALSADDVKSLYQNSAYIDNQGNIYGAVYEEV